MDHPMMDHAIEPRERTDTSQEIVEGVLVIGFVDRGPEGLSPDATYDQDVADFKSRMSALEKGRHPAFAVVVFSNYRMTGCDNGRALFGLLLSTHRRVRARGGGLLVCNHPA
jgi:hypothetical protein